MQIKNSDLDEQLLIYNLDELIGEELPEGLSSWEVTGEDAVTSLLSSDLDRVKLGKVSHVPAISPEAIAAVTWIPLVLGTVNTIFQIIKENKLIQKENLLLQKVEPTTDTDTLKLQAVEEIVKNELIVAGLTKSKVERISERLAKTIVLVIR